MKKKVAKGTPRMKQLGHIQMSLWLDAGCIEVIERLARSFAISKAEVLRRLLRRADLAPELVSGRSFSEVLEMIRVTRAGRREPA